MRITLALMMAASAIAALAPRAAQAQACCAGASAVTPARLALHEDALVGLSARATDGYGSFDPTGTFVAMPRGTSELDLEQDVFAALRLGSRGQAALLLPFVETRRAAPGEREFGGDIGDINASCRYDVLYAGQARYVPGIAVLAGLTLPTGTPPESAQSPLATGATGVGTYQGNAGISLEQAFGPWLVGATGLVALRAPRTARGVTEQLAPQWTALAVAAYTFRSEAALAVSASLTVEGDARIDGELEPGSHRRLVAVSASGALPLSDRIRLQGAVAFDPPISAFGVNQPVGGAGITITGIYAWL